MTQYLVAIHHPNDYDPSDPREKKQSKITQITQIKPQITPIRIL
jgi:hypothetical protein